MQFWFYLYFGLQDGEKNNKFLTYPYCNINMGEGKLNYRKYPNRSTGFYF